MNHNIRCFTTLLLLAFTMFIMASCSKKQEAIHQLQNFTEDVEKNGGQWSPEEWEQKAKVFTDLRAQMYKYDYDTEEQQQIGKLEGRCAAAFANHATGGLLKQIKDIGNQIQGALDGIGEGIDNSSHSDDDD